jgi:Zn finger protein HypA/HybF involved in hydrogenase expression
VHERSIASELVQQASDIVLRSGSERAVSVGIELGCSCDLSEPHLRSQFAAAAEGTPIEDALLDVTFSEATLNAESSGVVLTHVEVADPPM